jgi:hypothetical protein
MLKVRKYIVLIFAIFISFNSLSFAAVLGDANGNGKLDVADAIIILQTLVGLRPAEGGVSYYPSVVGYSWTYDVTPSNGTPYTGVTTVISSNSSGFSVKSQSSASATYGQTDYIYDGTALKYTTSYNYNADGTLSGKTENTPAALVLPSSMANNATESTACVTTATSGTGDTVMTSLQTRFITVNGEESVTTPAGTFTAIKITLTITTTPSTGTATVQTITYWYVKNIGRVKYVSSYTSGDLTITTTNVLRSYSQTSAVSDIQAITDVWMRFATFFATSLPSPTDPQFVALFATDYLDSGRDLNTQLTRFSTDPSMIVLQITNVLIRDIDLAAGTAWVSLAGTQNGRPFSENNNGPAPMKMVKMNGVWQIQGNRQIVNISGSALALYYPSQTNPANSIQTGFCIQVRANTPAGASVASAIISGPGLPTAGLTLTRQIAYDWFSLPGQGGDFYTNIDDATIGAIPDNAVYTFKLLNSSSAILATYTKTLRKRPLMRSELSAAIFPSVTAPTAADLRAFNGGNLTVTWTIPAGLDPDWMALDLGDTNWTSTARVEASLGTADRSKTLTIQPVTSTGVSFTPANRQLQVLGRDAYDREFGTILY